MKNILIVVICLILLGLAFFGGVKYNKANVVVNTDTVTVTDTIRDSIPVEVIITLKPKVITPPPDTFYIPFDSAKLVEIAKEFYTKNDYDTSITANEVKLDLKTTVYMNKLQALYFNIVNLKPEIQTTTTVTKTIVEPPKLQLGAAAIAGVDKIDAYGLVYYNTWLGGTSPFSKSVMVGKVWNINFKR